MATGWGLFQVYNGSNEFASDAWIRPAEIAAASFTWLADAIAFPEQIWCYRPERAFSGLLAVDPRDNRYIWVAATVGTSPNIYSVAYVYDSQLDTWTRLLHVALVGPAKPLPVDFGFLASGYTYLAIGCNGALGIGGTGGEGGVYISVDQGAFSYAGSGHEHAFNPGNINAVRSLTALDVSEDEDGNRTIITAHTLTRVNGSQATGWVTSTSTDDGATWHDPVSTYNGNQFQLECLTVLRLWSGTGGLWYVSDHSGTGAYSTSDLSARMDGTPSGGPTGSYGGGIFTSGSIAYPFTADADRGVAFPTAISTTLSLYSTANAAGTWTGHSQGTGHAGFAYRGGRTLDGTLTAAGVSTDNASHNSEIFWTEDGGGTWHSALAEENATGLSWDFGLVDTQPLSVWLEVLTYRDSRMFNGQARFYVGSVEDADALTNAQGIAELLEPLSNAQWTGATGPYTLPPTVPTPGTDDTYHNIEEVIRLTWITADGIAIYIDLPCPKEALFLDDQETISLLNADLSDAATGAITYKLCTRGGMLAVSFVGATRIMRGFRATQTIRTLDPGETSTAE